MKKIKISLITFTSLFFMNCDTDRCDEGYSEVSNSDGSSYCIKNFEAGIENKFEQYGNIFFQKNDGILEYKIVNGEINSMKQS